MNIYPYDLELIDDRLNILSEADMMRTYVKSSNIAAFWYQDSIVQGKGTLFVEFLNNTVYKFSRVPEEIAKNMEHAESKGKYFWKHIRGKFAYKQVKKETPKKEPASKKIISLLNPDRKRREILSLKDK